MVTVSGGVVILHTVSVTSCALTVPSRSEPTGASSRANDCLKAALLKLSTVASIVNVVVSW